MAVKFGDTHITDQKRLVRGEHLLQARSMLRARDHVHHRPWRIMIIAGHSPKGEVAALRELMPTAQIWAVDKDPQCIEAAVKAGVHKAVCCDLADDTPAALNVVFDMINLDFCGSATDEKHNIFKKFYNTHLSFGGAMLLTFSYGRDVVELFRQTIRNLDNRAHDNTSEEIALRRLREAKVPELIIGRLCCLMTPTRVTHIESVMVYRGPQTPMCSVLLRKGHVREDHPMSFVAVEDGDYELAVCYPDSVGLYDCPRERIEGLRRQFAAIKAVITRNKRLKKRASNNQAAKRVVSPNESHDLLNLFDQ
jgi:hypothetical protein